MRALGDITRDIGAVADELDDLAAGEVLQRERLRSRLGDLVGEADRRLRQLLGRHYSGDPAKATGSIGRAYRALARAQSRDRATQEVRT